MASRTGHMKDGDEVLVSYLPLSHVAAQIMDLYVPVLFAVTIYFAQPDALKVRVDQSDFMS